MTENTVKMDISFQLLLGIISSLDTTEKHQLWSILDAELFPDDEDFPEDIAEIQAARADYKAGDYMTFDEYSVQRAKRSV
jgi:hypothetical protein